MTKTTAANTDPEMHLTLVQAYNDWHVQDWCGAHPGRFIPLGLPMIWSAEATAREVHRLADLDAAGKREPVRVSDRQLVLPPERDPDTVVELDESKLEARPQDQLFREPA